MTNDPNVASLIRAFLEGPVRDWTGNKCHDNYPTCNSERCCWCQFTAALKKFADALTSPPAPSGWQPIETAPKDMTLILVAKRGGHITTLYGLAATETPSDVTDWDGCPPTHWMPLPSGPGQNAKDALPVSEETRG